MKIYRARLLQILTFFFQRGKGGGLHPTSRLKKQSEDERSKILVLFLPTTTTERSFKLRDNILERACQPQSLVNTGYPILLANCIKK